MALLATGYWLLSTVVLAEERVITLGEAYRLALTTHEAIMLTEEDLYQARKGEDKALSQLLPTITAEGTHTRYSQKKTSALTVIQPEESSRFELKVSQPLYTGGKEWSTRRQARMTTKGRMEDISIVREEIVMEVSNAYYGVLKAEENLEIKESALKRAGEQRRVAEARFRVGEVAKVVVFRAEAELASAQGELIKAKAELEIARDRLARFIGLPKGFKVTEPNAQTTSGSELEAFVSLAMEKRKDYIRATIDEGIAKEGITYAKGSFLPNLKLDGVYSRREQDPIASSFFNRESSYATLTLTFPLFEGGLRKAELGEARSKLRQAELRRLNLKRDIELEVREVFYNLDALHSSIETFKRQVSFAEENYRMVFKQFQYGLATNVDVVDANATLVSAQRGLANATYDLQVAILELKKRTGVLLDEVGVKDQ
ncbi:MAG: TolC family protein [Deltaproteobacteria bacterium]|nr:TolC family protein [Deltaproteobacteria bacterium]